MSSQIQSRSRPPRSSQQPPSQPPSQRPSPTALPPYEPPTFPLSVPARLALADLVTSRPRHTAATRRHLDKARSLLGNTVADVHEALVDARGRLEALSQSRRVREGNDEAAMAMRDRLAAHVAALEVEAAALGALMELGAREIVDWKAKVEDDAAAMGAARDEIDALARQRDDGRRQRRRRATREGGEAAAAATNVEEDDEELDEKQEPVRGALVELQEQQAAKRAEYESLGVLERYANNNDYTAFKRHYHESLYGDEQPLPERRKWFTSDGRPVLGIKAKNKRQRTDDGVEDDAEGQEAEQEQDEQQDEDDDNDDDGDDDDDDDIVVDREIISYRCPLSLQVMEEPYSNTKCKHTFDRPSIEAFIGRKKSVQCPQTGCSQTFSLTDFYLDEAMQRKIKRVREAERRKPRPDEDEDEDEDDEDTSMGGMRDGDESTAIPTSGQQKRTRHVVDDDDEDEEGD